MTDHKKPQGAPREFWINKYTDGQLVAYGYAKAALNQENVEQSFHVIEHSAYIDLQHELDSALAAASIHADEHRKVRQELVRKELADYEYGHETIKNLKAKRLKLREALQFYARGEHIIGQDADIMQETNGIEDHVVGKRARLALVADDE